MKFDRNSLTPEQNKEYRDVAFKRSWEQFEDYVWKGDRRAAHAYGGSLPLPPTIEERLKVILDYRSVEEMVDHAKKGAFGELVGSICTKCVWTKETGQYKGNRTPDLSPMFKGKLVECDARARPNLENFLYRERDFKTPDTMLLTVNYSKTNSICEVNYIFFGELKNLVRQNTEKWRGKHKGDPYWEVPLEVLNGDFSEFGK